MANRIKQRVAQALPLAATVAAAVLAGCVVAEWLSVASDASDIRAAAETGSLAESASAATAGETDLVGCFRSDPTVPPGETAGFWPGFRGAARDNVAYDGGVPDESWPEGGPEILWSIALGDGHAMPALFGGCLYLLDYDEARGGDCLRCFNADTGAERWEHLYAVKTKRNHGISRTVAAVGGGAVVTLGPQCHVLCLDASTGAYRWGIDLVKRYGTKVPLWYAGQCPLVDDDVAVLAPAGNQTFLCGIDVKTGESVFETPNPGGLLMSHSSVMVLKAEGLRQYVYAALGGIVGVAAEGPERGRMLWRTEVFTPSVVAPSPVPLEDGLLFMTAGYGSGGVMLKVSCVGGEWQVESLFTTDRRFFASEQQTPVFMDGLLYSVLPSDGGGERRQLVCMTPEGERLWASGNDDTFGLGPYLALPGGLMYLLDDAGTLTMARVGRQGFTRLARHALMDGSGRDAWGPMLLSDGRLYLRDSERLYCLKIGQAAAAPRKR